MLPSYSAIMPFSVNHHRPRITSSTADTSQVHVIASRRFCSLAAWQSPLTTENQCGGLLRAEEHRPRNDMVLIYLFNVLYFTRCGCKSFPNFSIIIVS